MNPLEKVNTLRGEHLNNASPIITCIGSQSDYKDDFRNMFRDKENLENIWYGENPKYLDQKSFNHAGRKTYVISAIDEKRKVSEHFYNCTGIVACGIDKKSGRNISLLSHQDPTEFLGNKKKEFVDHLKKRLAELKDMSIPGTIDCVVFGGQYKSHEKESQDEYKNSIKFLDAHIKEVLGFEPVTTVGPKVYGYDTVLYDTGNRRLYILREKSDLQPHNNEPFTPGNIEEEKNKWDT